MRLSQAALALLPAVFLLLPGCGNRKAAPEELEVFPNQCFFWTDNPTTGRYSPPNLRTSGASTNTTTPCPNGPWSFPPAIGTPG